MIEKTICVCEGGLFQSLAHRLSKEYDRVLYYRPWTSTFSHPNDLQIGKGYENIERIDDPLDPSTFEQIDTFCFPDVYFKGLQKYLRSIGKPVWGAFDGEDMEMERAPMKEMMKRVGLPVNGYEVVIGITALRKFLEKHEDRFVKVSRVRGLTETFHAKNYELVKPKIDDIESELGGLAEVQEFIVEEGIPDAIEVGYDGFSIHGQYPKIAQWGVEIKDCGYAAELRNYSDLPKSVRFVNDKLSGPMDKCGYQGFFSTEIRVGKDRNPYLIDFTARAASPAGECLQALVTNLGEIIEAGAHGELEEIKKKDRFAAQAIITSDFAEEHWLPIYISEKIRDNFKLYHSCKVGDQEYIVPTEADMSEIGSVVATGSTIDEAIKKCKELAEQIEGFQVKVKTEAMDAAKAELRKV